MHLRNLIDDDDAVSPVIGVILMVAITVILAAVIATFVLGLGEQVSETAPQASFTFDYNEDIDSSTPDSSFGEGCDGSTNGMLTITHAGGATMNAERMAVTGATGDDGNWADNTDSSDDPSYDTGSEISAGNDVTVCVDSDDTVSVTWTSETGQDSSTLRRWSGPDA